MTPFFLGCPTLFLAIKGIGPWTGWTWGCLQAPMDLHQSWSWEVLGRF